MSRSSGVALYGAAVFLVLEYRLRRLSFRYRLARVDRLLETGRGREARRVMAAIGEDVLRLNR